MKTYRTIGKWGRGAFFVLLLALSGCQTILGGSGYLRSSPALIEIDEHIRHQRFDLAVEVARKEIRTPFYPTQEYKAKILLLATMALSNFADNIDNKIDEEIHGYYNDALELMGEDNVFLSQLNNNVGNYFLMTARPLKTIQLFRALFLINKRFEATKISFRSRNDSITDVSLSPKVFVHFPYLARSIIQFSSH
jgi:hypothetical protein